MADPAIYVLAGVNGSGKSSIGGATLESRGVIYYNPDEGAKRLKGIHPNMSQRMANGHAWTLGKEMLEKAIAQRENFAFETTLGGRTMTHLLIEAAQAGIKVRVWYVGLESVELNIARVKARVDAGGHAIPEDDIRKRWDGSRRNLIKLLPHIDSLRLYDNSEDADPKTGKPPQPKLLLHIDARKLVGPDLSDAPEWAKPIVAGALNLHEH